MSSVAITKLKRHFIGFLLCIIILTYVFKTCKDPTGVFITVFTPMVILTVYHFKDFVRSVAQRQEWR